MRSCCHDVVTTTFNLGESPGDATIRFLEVNLHLESLWDNETGLMSAM